MKSCSPVESTYGTALRAAASTAGIPRRLKGPTVVITAEAPSRKASRRPDSPTSTTNRSASEGRAASFSGLRPPRRWGMPRRLSSTAVSLPVYPVAPRRAITGTSLPEMLAEELQGADPGLALGFGVVGAQGVVLEGERMPGAGIVRGGHVLAHVRE